jgi:hypothetical protein
MSHTVSYRPATPADMPLIMDSWLKSWRVSPWAGIIPNNTFYPLTRGVIEHIVMRGAEFEVACSEQKPDLIFGWICREQTNEQTPIAVIHFLYVKDPYLKYKDGSGRTIGAGLVGRAPGRPGLYTFRTRQLEEVARVAGFRHAPEVARRK